MERKRIAERVRAINSVWSRNRRFLKEVDSFHFHQISNAYKKTNAKTKANYKKANAKRDPLMPGLVPESDSD